MGSLRGDKHLLAGRVLLSNEFLLLLLRGQSRTTCRPIVSVEGEGD